MIPRELRVVIVEDEPASRAVLRGLLVARPGVAVCAEAGDGAAAVDAIRLWRPDLVFLDIQLPDLDGFEVLRRLAPAQAPQVVFVTAYDEFAVKAFEVDALDYLVKPFTDARFSLAFDRALARIGEGSGMRRSPGDLAGVADPAQDAAPPGHLLVRVGRRSLLVSLNEVAWVEAEGYYAALHVGGQTHLVRETMGALEARLDPARFVRIHRSAIVNLGCVRELRRDPAGSLAVILFDGTRLEVSRSRRRPLAQRLARRG